MERLERLEPASVLMSAAIERLKLSMKMRPVPSNRQQAFILMVEQATFADTGAAVITVEFIAVANLIPAFTAFYGSIDELKHKRFRSPRHGFVQVRQKRLSTVSLSRAMKNYAIRETFPPC